MPRSNDQTLKEALDHMLKAYRLKSRVQETRIISHWEEIVGEGIGRYTDDVYIRKKTLFVHIRNPALRNELLYSRDRIIDLVNEHAGEHVVGAIVIR